MRLARFPKWPELLERFIHARTFEPFAWGKNDCATFACDAVLAMTGTDLAEPLRRHTSALEAARALRAFLDSKESDTAKLLEATAEKIAAAWKIEEIPVLYAQRGDLVLVNTEEGMVLTVVSLNGYEVLAPGTAGLMRLPLKSARRAWRI